MSQWFVYMLRCADGSLYTGISTDVKRRVVQHNAGTGGAYTRSHRPVELVWAAKAATESAARKREAMMKKWPRDKKCGLI